MVLFCSISILVLRMKKSRMNCKRKEIYRVMKKVALHNLGCKVNAYETEAMQELLEKADMRLCLFRRAQIFTLSILAL